MNEYFLTKERAAVDSVLTVAGFNPNLAAVRSNGLNGEPQYKIEIDREKANALSLTVSDVNTTLSAAWGHLSDCLSVLDLL
jgi:multidrug efflux pump